MTNVWAIRDVNAPKGTHRGLSLLPSLMFFLFFSHWALISLFLRLSVSRILGLKLLGYLGWSGEKG